MPSTPLTRREFLYYIWAASLALLTGQAGAALLWFAYPRLRPGEFGATLTVPLEQVPPPGAPPQPFAQGRFWLVNVDAQAAADPRRPPGFGVQPGVVALYTVCVHLGCLYEWKGTNNRFECPCHGSKFLKDGVRLRGPATRDLDRFVIRAIDEVGTVLAETKFGNANAEPDAGQPISLPPGTAALEVNTGRRVLGRLNAGPPTVE